MVLECIVFVYFMLCLFNGVYVDVDCFNGEVCGVDVCIE